MMPVRSVPGGIVTGGFHPRDDGWVVSAKKLIKGGKSAGEGGENDDEDDLVRKRRMIDIDERGETANRVSSLRRYESDVDLQIRPAAIQTIRIRTRSTRLYSCR